MVQSFIIFGVVVLIGGISLFLPSLALTNETLLENFCLNNTKDNVDYENCFNTLLDNAYRNSSIGAIIMIVGLVIITLSLFPEGDPQVQTKRKTAI